MRRVTVAAPGQGSDPNSYEPTEAGPQALIAGVAPISLAARLALRAIAPLEPAKPQRACDLGLFDLNAWLQLDLFSKLPPGRPDG